MGIHLGGNLRVHDAVHQNAQGFPQKVQVSVHTALLVVVAIKDDAVVSFLLVLGLYWEFQHVAQHGKTKGNIDVAQHGKTKGNLRRNSPWIAYSCGQCVAPVLRNTGL